MVLGLAIFLWSTEIDDLVGVCRIRTVEGIVTKVLVILGL